MIEHPSSPMMLLLDTNIWLELLLEQERADEVRQLFAAVPSDQLAMSHFSLHSLGVILSRHGRSAVLLEFVNSVFVSGSCQLLSIQPNDFVHIHAAMLQFRLDFDDAYQYTIAKQWNTDVVSFDKDFDRTDLRRRTPAEILTELK